VRGPTCPGCAPRQPRKRRGRDADGYGSAEASVANAYLLPRAAIRGASEVPRRAGRFLDAAPGIQNHASSLGRTRGIGRRRLDRFFAFSPCTPVAGSARLGSARCSSFRRARPVPALPRTTAARRSKAPRPIPAHGSEQFSARGVTPGTLKSGSSVRTFDRSGGPLGRARIEPGGPSPLSARGWECPSGSSSSSAGRLRACNAIYREVLLGRSGFGTLSTSFGEDLAIVFRIDSVRPWSPSVRSMA
jgi:hypothetical protein